MPPVISVTIREKRSSGTSRQRYSSYTYAIAIVGNLPKRRECRAQLSHSNNSHQMPSPPASAQPLSALIATSEQASLPTSATKASSKMPHRQSTAIENLKWFHYGKVAYSSIIFITVPTAEQTDSQSMHLFCGLSVKICHFSLAVLSQSRRLRPTWAQFAYSCFSPGFAGCRVPQPTLTPEDAS